VLAIQSRVESALGALAPNGHSPSLVRSCCRILRKLRQRQPLSHGTAARDTRGRPGLRFFGRWTNGFVGVPGNPWTVVGPQSGSDATGGLLEGLAEVSSPVGSRTREIYDLQLRLHILRCLPRVFLPLASTALAELTPELIRRWYATLTE